MGAWLSSFRVRSDPDLSWSSHINSRTSPTVLLYECVPVPFPFPLSSLPALLLPQEHLSWSLNIGFSWHLCDFFLLSVNKGKTSQVCAWSISPLMEYSHLFSCADFTIWWISKLKGSPYLSWHPQHRAMGTISVEYMNKTEKVWHQTACSWSPQCPHSPETK